MGLEVLINKNKIKVVFTCSLLQVVNSLLLLRYASRKMAIHLLVRRLRVLLVSLLVLVAVLCILVCNLPILPYHIVFLKLLVSMRKIWISGILCLIESLLRLLVR